MLTPRGCKSSNCSNFTNNNNDNTSKHYNINNKNLNRHNWMFSLESSTVAVVKG